MAEYQQLLKIAFGSVPKDGGTFTFYRNMRPTFRAYGIDLYCVTVGRREADLVESVYVDEGCVLLAEDTDDVKKQAITFVEWCGKEQIHIVMAINSVAILSALPHLPKTVRVVSRCANAFDEGYRVTLSGRERLMRIIALTPRLRDDLISKYDAPPAMIELIPNGIDPAPFLGVRHWALDTGGIAKDELRTPDLRSLISENIPHLTFHIPPKKPQLRLGFLGRLEHTQKGVLYLPEIVRELKKRKVDFHLRIAGKGKHRQELENGVKMFIDSGEVEMIGALTKDEVPGFLNSIDIYLFTSHFEGCPNALLEAMMAGCAPVAFLIEGIIDFVLDHGRTGFVAPMGDCIAFAGHIAQLQDRGLLQSMSKMTVDEAKKRFVPEVAAEQYARVFREVMAVPLPDFDPRPWSKFKIDQGYKPKGWRRFIPPSIKNHVRKHFGK